MPGTVKTALVIDALPALGGAEKVLMEAMALFPGAPIYTLLYNRGAFAGTPLAGRQVITSFIERLPAAARLYRQYLPLLPRAIEAFDLSGYERIMSFSYAVAHGVRLHPGQRHFSYTFTPMRYAWGINGLNGVERPSRGLAAWLFERFRRWDATCAMRVERFAAVSGWIAGWLRRAYRCDSVVIYPPVAVERFSPQAERQGYYLAVSRLVAHKRIDLMVKAFNALKLPLLVVGEGPEREHLERMAAPNIRFLGFLPDQPVAHLFGQARAFLSAGKEDFGIAMVEAQAAGCPVIAYRCGGALETVFEGETGLFFDELTASSLAGAVQRFERSRAAFHPLHIAARAQRFNARRFRQELAEFAGVTGEFDRA